MYSIPTSLPYKMLVKKLGKKQKNIKQINPNKKEIIIVDMKDFKAFLYLDFSMNKESFGNIYVEIHPEKNDGISSKGRT